MIKLVTFDWGGTFYDSIGVDYGAHQSQRFQTYQLLALVSNLTHLKTQLQW